MYVCMYVILTARLKVCHRALSGIFFKLGIAFVIILVLHERPPGDMLDMFLQELLRLIFKHIDW